MSDQNPQPTLLTAWKGAQARLKAAGIDSPSIDARILLETATGAGRVDILNDPYRLVTPEQAQALETLVERMERGEMTLEESLAAYEQGVGLYRQCQTALEQAELRVKLLGDPLDPASIEPFPAHLGPDA